ncbi:MAG TPA: RNA-binding protein [bacterium]|jgi:RNA recognition motif-containing protein
MNIYVGNLSMDVTKTDLQQAFEAHGKVSSATVIRDKFSGESRGFGFVEMPDQSEGQAALAALNGSELMGKNIVVSEARPRPEGQRGGGGGRSGGGRSGGGRSGGGRRF